MPRTHAVFLLLALPSVTLAQATFALLPPVAGEDHTYIHEISGNGQVVAGEAITGGQRKIVRGTLNGDYQARAMGFLGEYAPLVAHVSQDGSTVCGEVPRGGSVSVFRWGSEFSELFGCDGVYSLRLSPDGSLLFGGIQLTAPSSDTFVADVQGAVSYPLRRTVGYPYGRTISVVSGDASTGYGTGSEGEGPFRWNIASNQLIFLGPQTSGRLMWAAATSYDGSIVAGWNNLSRGAVWYHYTEAGPFLLHPTWTVNPADMSSDGTRIVGVYRRFISEPWRHFLWEAGAGLYDLQTYLSQHGAQVPQGFEFFTHSFNDMISISGDGLTIVGTGRTSATASYQGWRATIPAYCYPDCDRSTSTSPLNILDFICFLQRFSQGDIYANCDNSSAPPYLNAADFACFLTKFSSGCP